jgi:hypothetical protein
MRVAALLVGLVLSAVAADPARAQADGGFVSGTELHDYLGSLQAAWSHDPNTNLIQGAKGFGYIEGVSDALQMSGAICPAAGVSTEQEVAIVQKYLSANPERWHYRAADEVFLALRAVFPCASK